MTEAPCRQCPRNCGALRKDGLNGYCGVGEKIRLARAALHFGEEPCISGTRGSGTVFFSGCSLGCVFCQNRSISAGGFGQDVDEEQFRSILRKLVLRGCHNINLVTGSHYTSALASALEGFDPGVPVAWNSSGYELPETLRLLKGKVQIYMPDLKYALSPIAALYSHAPDYFQHATAAILEMYRQVGPYRMDREGLLRSGLLIRHLILPGETENTKRVIDWVSEHFEPGTVLFSLMAQYTPMPGLETWPALTRPVSREEYGVCCEALSRSRIETGFVQELSSAGTDMIPDFDLTGITPDDTD